MAKCNEAAIAMTEPAHQASGASKTHEFEFRLGHYLAAG